MHFHADAALARNRHTDYFLDTISRGIVGFVVTTTRTTERCSIALRRRAIERVDAHLTVALSRPRRKPRCRTCGACHPAADQVLECAST